MPDDFAPSVWDEWNAKSPREKAVDAVAADADALARLEALTADERSTLVVRTRAAGARCDGVRRVCA